MHIEEADQELDAILASVTTIDAQYHNPQNRHPMPNTFQEVQALLLQWHHIVERTRRYFTVHCDTEKFAEIMLQCFSSQQYDLKPLEDRLAKQRACYRLVERYIQLCQRWLSASSPAHQPNHKLLDTISKCNANLQDVIDVVEHDRGKQISNLPNLSITRFLRTLINLLQNQDPILADIENREFATILDRKAQLQQCLEDYDTCISKLRLIDFRHDLRLYFDELLSPLQALYEKLDQVLEDHPQAHKRLKGADFRS